MNNQEYSSPDFDCCQLSPVPPARLSHCLLPRRLLQQVLLRSSCFSPSFPSEHCLHKTLWCPFKNALLLKILQEFISLTVKSKGLLRDPAWSGCHSPLWPYVLQCSSCFTPLQTLLFSCTLNIASRLPPHGICSYDFLCLLLFLEIYIISSLGAFTSCRYLLKICYHLGGLLWWSVIALPTSHTCYIFFVTRPSSGYTYLLI